MRLTGKIDRKYNINKIFIDKYFPPGYRKTAHKIVDVTGALAGGYGIYGLASSLLDDDDDQDGGPTFFQPSKTNKFYKKSNRFRRSPGSKRGKFKCYPKHYRWYSMGRR